MTSFSRTAVCMRRTLDWFLQKKGEEGKGIVSLGQEERSLVTLPA